MKCVYADGCSFTDENQETRAEAGIYWPHPELHQLSQGYQLGKQTSQYAELAAVLIALMQVAIELHLKEIVICTDSEYVSKTFLEYLQRWRQLGMVNSKGKPVKNATIISTIESLVTQSQIDVYWKKVKGHSQEVGQDKEGNDHANSLAKEGAINGQKWELVSSTHSR